MRKVFVNEDGTVSRSADRGCKVLRFELFETAKTDKEEFVVCDTVDFELGNLPERMVRAAMGHGLAQKMGDSVAGIVKYAAREEVGFTPDAKTGYAALIRTLLTELWEDISNGFWTEERAEGEGGASVTILLQGILRAFAAEGIQVTDAQLEGLRAKLGNKEARDALAKRNDIKVHVAAIRAERAAEAAKKALEAAAANKPAVGLAELLGDADEDDDDSDN
jgi:hypothetical protein